MRLRMLRKYFIFPSQYELSLWSVWVLAPESRREERNFAALNRGRHLYSAGRPSRWALAHISNCVIVYLYMRAFVVLYLVSSVLCQEIG